MRDFPIPVVALGPGSQPADEVDLEFMPMPQVELIATPIPPQDAAPEDLAVAADVIERLMESMRRHVPGGSDAPRFSVKSMAPNALRALNESLGQGEVSALVAGPDGKPVWRAQETAFPGVWRVRREDGRGQIVEDVLEAGDMPKAVKDAARQPRGARLDPALLGPDVINAPSIVDELRHHANEYRPGRPAHVVNLSLLPFSPADHESLDAMLGVGPVSMLSRGFGNCRIGSTLTPGVWRVRYYNSMSTLILDTIEVVDLPEAARAGVEDYEDSLVRMEELLGWLREED